MKKKSFGWMLIIYGFLVILFGLYMIANKFNVSEWYNWYQGYYVDIVVLVLGLTFIIFGTIDLQNEDTPEGSPPPSTDSEQPDSGTD